MFCGDLQMSLLGLEARGCTHRETHCAERSALRQVVRELERAEERKASCCSSLVDARPRFATHDDSADDVTPQRSVVASLTLSV